MSNSQHDDRPRAASIKTASQPRKLHVGESPQSLARDGYNTAAQTYLDWTTSLPDYRVGWLNRLFQRFEVLHPSRLSQTRGLDLGCGAGVPATLCLAQTCKHVTGVEISATQISLGRSSFAKAGVPEDKYVFQESDMMAASFSADSFDLVCGFYSLIHLSLADQRELLARIYNWITPGGMLLFNASTQASGADGMIMENWLGMTAYWASYGEEKTLEIVRGVGFEVLEHQVQDTKGDATFTWIIALKPQPGPANVTS